MKNINDYRRGNCSQTTGEQLAPSVPSHGLARPAFSLIEGAWGERSGGGDVGKSLFSSTEPLKPDQRAGARIVGGGEADVGAR